MNSSDQLIEQLLVLRCQVGDKDAFAELIERYQAPLRYFISRLLENTQMTEDIFQDTWLTVIGRIHSLKNIDTFSTWLYRIARNKVYQQLRRKKKLSKLDENFTAPDDDKNDVFSPEDMAKVHICLQKLLQQR